MEQIIRACTPADAPAIAEIYDPIVANTVISFEETPPGPDEIRRRIVAAGDRYPWLACVRDGEFAGYAYASAHRSRAAYRWSVDLSAYVAPDARRTGVARRLYTALFDILARQGYAAAFAGIALPNEPSVAFHRSTGFRDVGTYHAVGYKLGAWHDVLWLERRLRPPGEAPAEIVAFDQPSSGVV